MASRKKSQIRLFPQKRGKINMGALPHMAVLAKERPILVATPWVLVPKGVQVHRPPGNGHRASHDQPTDHRPIVQWRRHIWPTGHAQSPGTSHRAITNHRANGRGRDLQPTVTRHRPGIVTSTSVRSLSRIISDLSSGKQLRVLVSGH